MVSLTKKVFHSKVKAATLLEVVVGLVIIAMVFGIVVVMYTQLFGSSLTMKKYRAILLLNQEAVRIKKERHWTDEEFQTNEFTIVQRMGNWQSGYSVKVLSLEALDEHGKSIAKRNELINLHE